MAPRADDSSPTEVDVAVAPAPPRGPAGPTVVATAEAPRSERVACLVVVATPTLWLGRRFELGSRARIGSAPDNDVVLALETVAAHHARVERGRGGARLVVDADAGSATTTWHSDVVSQRDRLVRGEAPIFPGDRFALGRVVLAFIEADSAARLRDAYHDAIYEMTTHDGLTGLQNERWVFETMAAEARRPRRAQVRRALAVMELDGIEDVARTRGACDADRVLRAVARSLSHAPFAGERMGLSNGQLAFLFVAASQEEALERAEAVRVSVTRRAVDLEDGPVGVQASAGVALLDAGDDARSALARARERLAEAKRGGGACTRV